jgi:hypothetical protein
MIPAICARVSIALIRGDFVCGFRRSIAGG